MSDSEETNISTIKIKVPQFHDSNINAWFLILEAQFHLARITSSQTQFYHALSNLPPEVISKISPTELTTKNYETFKASILATYERSKTEMFQELLSKKPFNGRPSDYLRDIMNLANKLNIGNDIVKIRFLEALPMAIRAPLAARPTLPLEELGALANDILPLVAGAHQADVYPLQTTSAPTPRQSTFNSEIPYGLRPYHQEQRPKICRAHLYFTDAARTCTYWCKYPNKKNVLSSSRPPSHHKKNSKSNGSKVPSSNISVNNQHNKSKTVKTNNTPVVSISPKAKPKLGKLQETFPPSTKKSFMAPQGTTISVNHLTAKHNGETLNVKPIAYSGDNKQNSQRQNPNKEEDDSKEEDVPKEEDDSNEVDVSKQKENNSILKKCYNTKKKSKNKVIFNLTNNKVYRVK